MRALAVKEAEMIVCGIEVTSSEARLLILSGIRSHFEHIPASPRKLELSDNEDSVEVEAFRDAVHAFLREYGVERVAIKKRNTKGDYAGSPVSFKLEGIIQLHRGCPVLLAAPQSIAAAIRRNQPATPAGLFQYQRSAFETAFWALPSN